MLRASAQAAPEQASPNLVRNPDLEGSSPGRTPAGWEPLVIGAPAQFGTDGREKRGGRQSIRITAPEVTRAYVRSAPIPVAPGEQIRAGAWVKHQGVPPDKGTVIVIAEFADAEGRGEQVAKVGVAATGGASGNWQHVEGSVTVPPLAATLRLRLGFSYAQGTSWWDDVTVHALQPLVARIELSGPRLVPAMETLPVTVLNRAGTRGPVRARVTLDRQQSAADAVLSGAPTQRIAVPIKVAGRGRLELTASLLAPGQEKPLFTEGRRVTVPPPLVLLPPIPTHWAREDGAPQVAGEAELAVTRAERGGATLTARLLDGEGRVRAAWSTGAARVVPDGLHRFSLQAPGLPEGAYRLVAELRPREGKAIRAEQPWEVISRRRARVTLNTNGYLEQDGRTIFPLGLFNGGARMAEMGQAGFTVSHAYNAVRVEPGQRPDDQRAKDFLDATGKAGMRAVFLVPMKLAIAGDWEGFRRRIRMFRNHPALLAWDEEEGLARGDMKGETLGKIRGILREEDPHHPFLVGDSRDVIGRVTDRSNFFPLAHMDLGMWWWYPIPPGPKPGDALEGEELVRSKELVPPSFLTLRNTDKPIWVGVQSYKKPGPGARYPDPAEYRAQAYIALLHGAKGLLWYGGSVTGGLYLSPQEGHWEYLKTLAAELSGLAPVFMAPGAEPPKFLPAGAPISVALKRAKGRLVLLAVNRGAEALDVTFALPEPAAGSAQVLTEKRMVNAAGGQMRDRFEPYAVHVYELPQGESR